MEHCTWTMDSWDPCDSGDKWDTTCGESFVFLLDGGPAENHIRFCCYCGKPVREGVTARADGDADADETEHQPGEDV